MAETLGLILIQYFEGKLALVKRFSNVIGFILITIINSTSCSLAIYMLSGYFSTTWTRLGFDRIF